MTTSLENLPSPTGPHSLQESPLQLQSRHERKIRRAFAKLVGAAPEAAERMMQLMGSDNQMVAFLAAKFILSADGLGEIQKSVQKTTADVRVVDQRKQDLTQTFEKLRGTELDEALKTVERIISEHTQVDTNTPQLVEGEFTDVSEERPDSDGNT